MALTKNPTISIQTLAPLHEKVFVTEIEQGVKISRGGIIIPDDDGADRGIHPRWAQVYAVGPEVDDLTAGEWVLVEHGRWTNRIPLSTPEGDVDVWSIDYPDAVLLVADEDPRLSQISL